MGDKRLQAGWVWMVIVSGLLLRLAIAPLAVHPGDEPAFARWGRAIQAGGLLDIYLNSDANYPPLGMALLGLSVGIHDMAVAGEWTPPEGIGWRVALKLPAILADLGLMLLAARPASLASIPAPETRPGVKSPWPRRRYSSLHTLALVAFNPALILMSAYWGQLDSIYVALGIASVILAARRRFGWAGALAALALGVKLQAAMALPVLFLLCWREGGRARQGLAIGFATTILVLSAPWLLRGEGAMLAARLIAVKVGPGWLTINALNAWFLISGGAGNWAFNMPLAWPDSAALAGGISARGIGLLLWGGWTLITLWGGWKRLSRNEANREREGLWLAGMLWLGMFLWPTGAHERYALGAAAAWALAAGWSRPDAQGRALPLQAWVISALLALNLLWAAPVLPGLLAEVMGVRWIGLVISAAMLGLGTWGMVNNLREEEQIEALR